MATKKAKKKAAKKTPKKKAAKSAKKKTTKKQTSSRVKPKVRAKKKSAKPKTRSKSKAKKTSSAGKPKKLKVNQYAVKAGPEAFLPPAAASMGIVLPDPGEAHIEGRIVPEEEAFEFAARKLLEAKVPTIFPGPLVLWKWNEKAAKKATAIRALANAVPSRLIPMADYRPKYPKIDPEVEINPNHPNLTIWHNKIDVCIFVGVHCHQANLALKIIRGGTNCFTIAMCAQAGHEDACLSFRDATPGKIIALADAVEKLKQSGVQNQGNKFTQFKMDRTGRID